MTRTTFTLTDFDVISMIVIDFTYLIRTKFKLKSKFNLKKKLFVLLYFAFYRGSRGIKEECN